MHPNKKCNRQNIEHVCCKLCIVNGLQKMIKIFCVGAQKYNLWVAILLCKKNLHSQLMIYFVKYVDVEKKRKITFCQCYGQVPQITNLDMSSFFKQKFSVLDGSRLHEFY
jgi:hypothetical protein